MSSFYVSVLSLLFGSPTRCQVEIKISSDSLKSINEWDKTEPYLLGVFSTWGGETLKDTDFQTEINEEYGTNMIAYNTNMGAGILPKDDDEAVSCCTTTADLKSYVLDLLANDCTDDDGTRFKWARWNDDYYKEETTIDTYLYGHDVCKTGDYPTVGHCVAADDSAGWGVPDNDDSWWNWMYIGNIGCALKRNPELKYWHIWNEPNAVFKDHDRDGDDYALFYFQTAKAIKNRYPDITLAGPVTWCIPLYKTVFDDYFKPLMDKVVSKGREDLLDYIDFHAYSNNDEYNPYARWDMVVSSVHVNALYWNGLTNGDGFIRSQMTETNVALDEDEVSDDATYWEKRVMSNAKQIMALSHNTDKFLLRIQFALGIADEDEEVGNHYGWLTRTDKYMQDIIKPIQNGYPVYFEFTDGVEDGYPTYDNGDGIMAQAIYNDEDDTITVLLINYKNANTEVTLYDKDIKVVWDTEARFTRRWGPNTLDVTKDGTRATLTLKPLSITAVTGSYRALPATKVVEYEFGPMDESQIMQDVGYKTYEVDETINIELNTIPTGLDPEYAYIKFGLGYGAITDFSWTVKVKVGSTTYMTKSNFVPDMNFTQFPITSTSFLNKISAGNQVDIQFIGERTNYPGSYWQNAPLSGRIAFASLVVGGSIEASYIKITNGVDLTKWYYACKLSNKPSGISISWVKMKSDSQTAWQLGSWNSNNGYWEWRDGPYTAPFDFMIKSTDGQIIYSWNIIDSLNDKDSGFMIQTFGSAYTEQDDNGSGTNVVEYIAIGIAVLVGVVMIGICIFCIVRRKMKDAVTFDHDSGIEDSGVDDSKEKVIKDDGDTPDGNEIASTGGYDMSPIDTQNDEEEQVEKDEEVEI